MRGMILSRTGHIMGKDCFCAELSHSRRRYDKRPRSQRAKVLDYRLTRRRLSRNSKPRGIHFAGHIDRMPPPGAIWDLANQRNTHRSHNSIHDRSRRNEAGSVRIQKRNLVYFARFAFCNWNESRFLNWGSKRQNVRLQRVRGRTAEG